MTRFIRAIPPVVHSTRKFHYSKSSNNFVAEASDFGPTSEVFNEYFDKPGFVMASHVTGDQLLFKLESVDKDSDGDVAGWRFRATHVDSDGVWVEAPEKFRSITALIIND